MTATRTKRILSIQNVWDGGGSEKALVRMVRQLHADGWDCHVAVGGPPRLAAEYAAAGATVHIVPMQRVTTSGGLSRWPRYAAAWPVSVARLVWLGRRLDVDVVHTNTLHSWYGWAAAAVLRRPHVWHAREIVVQSALALRVERFLTRRFADLVVAISEAVAAQFTATGGAARRRGDSPTAPGAEGAEGRHRPWTVVVAYDEPDPSEFMPALAGRFRARVDIPDTALLVGSVGRLDTWKGVDVLLDAVAELRARRPGVEVLVAGPAVDGKEGYAAHLASRAAPLGVRWLGPREDVPELLADLDVYVMPSTEPEPFGLGLVEALASGTPAVATDAGGPIEVVAPLPPSAGRLVPRRDPAALAEAIDALLPHAGSSTGQRRGRAALRVSQAPAFSTLFESVLRAGRGGRSPRRRHQSARPDTTPAPPGRWWDRGSG